MRPTRFLTLLGAAAIGSFVGLLSSDLFARQGHPVFIAPASLAFTLPAIAILLLAMAWPIVRYRRAINAAVKAKAAGSAAAAPGNPIKRVDPFYAVRVLLLAKASALTSSVILGWQVGVLIYLFSRPAQAADSLARTIGAAAGSAILLVVALIVERMCRLPNDAPESPKLGSAKPDTETGIRA